MRPVAGAVTCPTFAHALTLTLVAAALLTSGRRTVTAALRAVGLGDERHFTTYQRVRKRTAWSPLSLSRSLLGLLVSTVLAPHAPLVLLIDSTLERRWGSKIALKGRSHAAGHATKAHPVTTAGIDWLCLTVLVPRPWSTREWALPFLTIPTRAPALSRAVGKSHRTMPDDAPVLIRRVGRWQPDRALIVVGDSAFAVARLGHTCRRLGGRRVWRLLLTAQLYDPDPVPLQPRGKPGVKPQKGPPQAKLQDRLAPTDPAHTPWLTTEIDWYAGQRLPLEVATQRARWPRDGEAPLPIGWVWRRDPSGERDPFARWCSDDHVALPQIIAG